jgi:hypothetical protein
VLRVARYAARAPVAESRLHYDAERGEVELASEARAGPYVGVERMSALEFLARWADHVPGRYETRIRYYRIGTSMRVEPILLSSRRRGRGRIPPPEFRLALGAARDPFASARGSPPPPP